MLCDSNGDTGTIQILTKLLTLSCSIMSNYSLGTDKLKMLILNGYKSDSKTQGVLARGRLVQTSADKVSEGWQPERREPRIIQGCFKCGWERK